jgi:hypothetical protein
VAYSRLLTSRAIDSHLKSANMPYNRHPLPRQLQELVAPACLLITQVMRQQPMVLAATRRGLAVRAELINKE